LIAIIGIGPTYIRRDYKDDAARMKIMDGGSPEMNTRYYREKQIGDGRVPD